MISGDFQRVYWFFSWNSCCFYCLRMRNLFFYFTDSLKNVIVPEPVSGIVSYG